MKSILLPVAAALVVQPSHAHDDFKVTIPAHYVVRKHCTPGRGFFAAPQAAGQPAGYPFMALLVFNDEVIGFLFEVHEKDGWKPWYDQPEGKPVSHGSGPRHYSQTIMIRNGPSAEACKAAMR